MATATAQAMPVDMMRLSGQGPSGSLPAGSLFGLPGVTQLFEQKENNDQQTVTLSQTSTTTVTFAAPFKQSDVVFGWELGISISQVIGTANCTLSDYYPYQYIGTLTLNFQNQQATLSYLFGGIDAAIFQVIRPSRRSWIQNWTEQGTFATDAYSVQANQMMSTSNTGNTGTQTVGPVWYDLVPGIYFDLYYDLAPDGRFYTGAAAGISTFVTPAAMAGSNRIVQPTLQFNPGFATTRDNSPLITGASSTFSGTATLSWRRRGYLQPTGQADAPLFWNWQYSRITRKFTIGQVSSMTVPLEPGAQILAFFIRMFDPTLNSAAGGALPIASVSECDVQIANGIFKFQDTPADVQRRFYRKHGVRLPEGVLAWDLALDNKNKITNADAINTLTTASCVLNITFTGAQNAGSYLVLGTEMLRYTAFQ